MVAVDGGDVGTFVARLAADRTGVVSSPLQAERIIRIRANRIVKVRRPDIGLSFFTMD
jgi:hypothetical protein